MNNFYLEHLTNPQDWLALADEWPHFLAQCPAGGIFQSWEWLSTWWHHFGAAYQPWLILARAKGTGQLLGAAPLMRGWKKSPVPYRELLFIGSPLAAPDHLDLLVAAGAEKAVLPALLAEIWGKRAQWELWRLVSVPAGSPTIAWLGQTVPAGQQHSREIPCPYIPLPADWQTFRAQLGKNHRRNIQRYDRYLAEAGAGEVVYGQLASRDEIPALLSQLAQLHQAVQTEQGHKGAFHDPRLLPFQTEVAQLFHGQGWLRLYWLQVGPERIAMMYCFEFKGRLSFYITGYQEAWSRFGPGRQVIAYAIQDCIGRGLTTFDFLRGDEAYKFDWTAQTQTNLRMTITGSWYGRLLSRLRRSYE